MKTCITISLLPSNPNLPFVLGPELDQAVGQAAELGYDAFELFPPTLAAIDSPRVRRLCRAHEIAISTIGTGGGAVTQGLTLTDADPSARQLGLNFVRGIIERAGDLGASAIIGSMQGRIGDRSRPEFMKRFGETLADLGRFASKWDQSIFYEPLNRYESDVLNTVADAAKFIRSSGANNVFILADLFHMNIEEVDLVASLRQVAPWLGHVHFVDSNRRSPGFGHLNLNQIADVLDEIEFGGYLAVEALPLPDQGSAAQRAMDAFRQFGLVEEPG